MKWLYSTHKAARYCLKTRQYRLHGGSCSHINHHVANPFGLPKSARLPPYQKESSSLFPGPNISTSAILNATEPSHRLINGNNIQEASVKEVITKRSKDLKETLSQILTKFYPLAGEIKENTNINAIQMEAYFVEARVNQKLEDFIRQPDDHKVRELIPESPRTTESSKGNYVMGIQVNIFYYGGIGLSTSLSHKIFDGQTYFRVQTNFQFNTYGATRMESTSTVLWKAVVNTTSALRTFTPQSPHALFTMMNIRKRASPPFANESFGNIVDIAGAICFPDSQPDLATLTRDSEITKGKPLVWFLHETLKGGGVEARVTMSPDEMDIFERDPELLSYATVDPDPSSVS
ncbi:stemmadenine O-acetyltransferase [Tanacetum coccineum]